MKRALLLVCVLSLSCGYLSAGPITEFLTFTYTDNTTNRPGSVSDQTIGWSFTVGASPVTVSQLSWFDPDHAGGSLTATHQVRIYNSTGSSIVADACVGGGPSPGCAGSVWASNYWTQAITPTVLAAGTTYVIGGKITRDERFVWTADSVAMIAGLTYGTNRYHSGGIGVTFPESVLASPPNGPQHLGFFGPNMGADLGVPEPATMLLMGAGLVLVGALRKRVGKKV